MNVLLRVTSCRVLEMMKKDPAYAEQIGLTDVSKTSDKTGSRETNPDKQE